MKKINFNIKDRKILSLVLCLVLVCVFTLTVAYSALNTILTIQGNAEITASTWDIHLENPVVKSGSATTEVPIITSGKTLSFNTLLNMPGDFYEFTVDVVNGGSIDAMIEDVVKTPDLTVDQAKYLKYEVSYANGESISTKQNIAAGVTMPIKVRVEYRSDLSNGDLPTGQVVLNLSLVLDYIQSDGSGSNVSNNGAEIKPVTDGDVTEKGTIVTIGNEQFYTIGMDENNVKLLAMRNITLGENSVQSSNAGKTVYASEAQHGTNYSDYNGSVVEVYVNNYKNNLETSYKIDIVEARLITNSELIELGCNTYACGGSNEWIYSTIYWTGSAYDSENIWRVGYWLVGSNSIISDNYYYIYSESFGVRPVIVISKDYFN